MASFLVKKTSTTIHHDYLAKIFALSRHTKVPFSQEQCAHTKQLYTFQTLFVHTLLLNAHDTQPLKPPLSLYVTSLITTETNIEKHHPHDFSQKFYTPISKLPKLLTAAKSPLSCKLSVFLSFSTRVRVVEQGMCH